MSLCLFCLEGSQKTNPGIEYVCGSCVQVLLIAKQDDLRKAHVSSIEDLILELEKLNPDAVEIDMGLHDRIGGIDTVQLIKDRLDVNAWFE